MEMLKGIPFRIKWERKNIGEPTRREYAVKAFKKLKLLKTYLWAFEKFG